MKKCFKCGEVKDLSEFYKHSAMADGYLGKCKQCARIDAINVRNAKLEKYRAYDRYRYENQPQRKEALQIRSKTEKQRLIKKIACNKYYYNNIIKNHSRAITKYALSCGRLIRADKCEFCGSTQYIQGHHEDYEHPMQITWLCRTCHANRHKELREIQRRLKYSPFKDNNEKDGL